MVTAARGKGKIGGERCAMFDTISCHKMGGRMITGGEGMAITLGSRVTIRNNIKIEPRAYVLGFALAGSEATK